MNLYLVRTDRNVLLIFKGMTQGEVEDRFRRQLRGEVGFTVEEATLDLLLDYLPYESKIEPDTGF